MNLQDYFKDLRKTNPQREFIEKVSKECGVSDNTIYYWIKNNNAPKLAKEKIAEITGIEVTELFPE